MPNLNARPNSCSLTAWALLLPMLLWLVAFVVAPTGILFIYSFGQTDDVGRVVPPDDFHQSLDNYRRVAEKRYVRIILRSVWYAGLATGVCVVIGYPIAFAIARSPDPWRNRLLIAVMVPFWTSFLIRTYAWLTILSADGLLAGVLRHLHLLTGDLDVLYTPTAVMIGLVYTYLPFMILPIYGSVQKLDGALIEASFDLGAGPISTFRRVIWPLTKPGVGAGIVLTFVPAIAMFAINDLLGGGRVEMIGNTIETQFNTSRDWPFGSALGIVVTVLFAAAFALAGRRGDEIT
jgi:spermidine/putrescine transport system permease protein